MINSQQIQHYVENLWDSEIIAKLMEYIRIPNKSPAYDDNWEKHGHMEQAVKLIADWCLSHTIPGMTLDVVRIPGRTPVIFIEIPGQSNETVLLYGHLDKQPEMSGWDSDLGPWQPVLKDEKLYGRGGADDGYAAFASLTAILALHEQKIPHARCVILIEACEESGSYDLPYYVDALQDRIGQPSLVVCLDSGCGNYEQLWSTTNLRGMVGGVLTVEILKEGVHSGYASGIVPSAFRIIRQLLSRIENEQTGEFLLRDCYVDIPQQRLDQAKITADILGDEVAQVFPFVTGARAISNNNMELILNRTWRPTLSVIGMDDMPVIADAGNVLQPKVALKLSLRIPPMVDPEKVGRHIKEVLEANPPYGAKVGFTITDMASGWNAPAVSAWLAEANDEASLAYFGKPSLYLGEGGTIPFMAILGEKYPQAQFLITGVLGPQSNAHGPNEFLHIPMAKKLTSCVAHVIAKHFLAGK